jgi:hypothetical protein
MKKLFKVTIRLTNKLKEWGYEPNSKLEIPVYTNNKYNAQRKVENKYWGSEYPMFDVISISEYDDFFQPIL